ncbi:hypothetical protein TNCV_2527061 [Trichonephila clavipes]|nr:hypothetical protein TNCV_2527061 [Trichonephila clavipes]
MANHFRSRSTFYRSGFSHLTSHFNAPPSDHSCGGHIDFQFILRNCSRVTELPNTSFSKRDHDTLATRGLLATDHVILNRGQVTWTTPELAPASSDYHHTPTGGHFSSRKIQRASLPYTASP